MSDVLLEPLEIIYLELPTAPNRANNSRGWKDRYFGKKRYIEECAKVFMTQKFSRRHTPWKRILWTAHCQVARMNDADNLMARLKWSLDAMVDCRLLVDDGPGYAWPYTFPSQEVKKGKALTTFFVIKVLK